jgi:hypothetical protein
VELFEVGANLFAMELELVEAFIAGDFLAWSFIEIAGRSFGYNVDHQDLIEQQSSMFVLNTCFVDGLQNSSLFKEIGLRTHCSCIMKKQIQIDPRSFHFFTFKFSLIQDDHIADLFLAVQSTKNTFFNLTQIIQSQRPPCFPS